jgi:hypothetical protein
LQAAGDEHGVSVSQLEVTSESGRILTVQGTLPVRIDPAAGSSLLQIATNEPIVLHASTEPDTNFWAQIAAWTRVSLDAPHIQLDISGPLSNPTGKILASIDAIHPEALWTNGPIPHLEHLQAELHLERSAVRLDSLSVRVEGQPVQATAEVPLGSDFSAHWRRFFQWQKATGGVQVAKAQINSFARFLPKEVSPQGFINADLTSKARPHAHSPPSGLWTICKPSCGFAAAR